LYKAYIKIIKDVGELKGDEQSMWLRNIIWFILLVGIIMFSILLFLLVMDPVPDYNTPATSEETVGTGQGATAETKQPPSSLSPEDTSHAETKQQDATDKQKVETQTGDTKKEQIEPAPKEPTKTENPAGPGQTPVSFLYQMGRVTGYLTVIFFLFPIGLLSMTGKRQTFAMRRFSTGALPFFPLSSLLALSAAMIHGGMMLRMVADWNRHLVFGVALLCFAVLFLIRASLIFISPNTKGGRAFPVFIALILLLYVIHVIG
jgi:hypothetical protein